ncbi:hypothetical protein AAF712_015808 [Marasmius tenuissimus]|uniref:Uncharacterized protein n=1 Tax=Marasmius tenuissimus TaxID=585030 RepID=A0ABR2Z8H6_9AGAR
MKLLLPKEETENKAIGSVGLESASTLQWSKCHLGYPSYLEEADCMHQKAIRATQSRARVSIQFYSSANLEPDGSISISLNLKELPDLPKDYAQPVDEFDLLRFTTRISTPTICEAIAYAIRYGAKETAAGKARQINNKIFAT